MAISIANQYQSNVFKIDFFALLFNFIELLNKKT
jgi:hypothetical protein